MRNADKLVLRKWKFRDARVWLARTACVLVLGFSAQQASCGGGGGGYDGGGGGGGGYDGPGGEPSPGGNPPLCPDGCYSSPRG